VHNPHSYQTLETLSEGLYKEKGSKFIGYAVPCRTEEEAKQHLNEWKKNAPPSTTPLLCLSFWR